MATLESSTGSNTSANSQAIIKVSEGGCLTTSLASALEKQLIVEFPNALGSSGTVDVLTSTAVNQVVAAILVDPDFTTQLTALLQGDAFVQLAADNVLTSTTFATNLSTAIETELDTQARQDAISTFLQTDTAFLDAVTTYVLASATFTTAIQNRVDAYIASLSLFECTQGIYTVITGNIVNVPITSANGTNIFFTYNITSYDAAGGGTDTTGDTVSWTPSQATISLPNTLPGDRVGVSSLRVNC